MLVLASCSLRRSDLAALPTYEVGLMRRRVDVCEAAIDRYADLFDDDLDAVADRLQRMAAHLQRRTAS